MPLTSAANLRLRVVHVRASRVRRLLVRGGLLCASLLPGALDAQTPAPVHSTPACGSCAVGVPHPGELVSGLPLAHDSLRTTTVAPQPGSARRIDGRLLAPALAILVGISGADEPLRATWRGPGPPIVRSTARIVEPLGRARVALVGLGASYISARIARQPAWARATVRIAAGYLAADAVTATLKPGLSRARPMAERGAYDFDAFYIGEHRNSFPSGHTTHAFALAAGIAEEADRPLVTVLAYGTATLVGWSRLHDDAHWTSDVVAGAVVGVSASLTTIRWLKGRQRTVGDSTAADARTPRSRAFEGVALGVSARGVSISMPF